MGWWLARSSNTFAQAPPSRWLNPMMSMAVINPYLAQTLSAAAAASAGTDGLSGESIALPPLLRKAWYTEGTTGPYGHASICSSKRRLPSRRDSA